MKYPNYYLKDLMMALACNDRQSFTDIIRRIQDDAAMEGFQNTTEEFNMEAIQGNEDFPNNKILEILQK